MGLVRALVRPAEAVIRPRELQSRIFWQKTDPRPTYIRGKGDVLLFSVTSVAIGAGLVSALSEANELIKGKQ